MLTIRLNRAGKKNKPFFRIALQEHVIAPGGRHVEILGSYDPHSKKTILKKERIQYWMEKGTQISDTVYNLLVKEGIAQGSKRKVKIPAKKAAEVKAEEVKAEAPAVADKAEEKKEEIQAAEAPKTE